MANQKQQNQDESFMQIVASFIAAIEQGKKMALERMRQNQQFNQQMRREMDRRESMERGKVSLVGEDRTEKKSSRESDRTDSPTSRSSVPSDVSDQAAAYAADPTYGAASTKGSSSSASETRETTSSSGGGDWRTEMADAVDMIVDHPHLSLDDETLQKMADMGVDGQTFATMSSYERLRFDQFGDAFEADAEKRPDHPDHVDEAEDELGEPFEVETLKSIVTTFINEDTLTESERMNLVNTAIQNDILDIRSMVQTDREIYDSLVNVPGQEKQAQAMLEGSDEEFDLRRDALVEAVEIVQGYPEVRLTGETWEAIVEIDADGYLTEALGPTGRSHFDAVKRDLSSQVNADGPDISRSVDQAEMNKALERRASMRKEASRQLDEITGEITPEVEADVPEPKTLAPEFESFLRAHGRDSQGNRIEYVPDNEDNEPQRDPENGPDF